MLEEVPMMCFLNMAGPFIVRKGKKVRGFDAVINKRDDCVIFVPEEKLNQNNSQRTANELLELYNKGFPRIILDFSNVKSIDSSTLGKLLVLQKKLKEAEGGLQIINITNSNIKKVFQMIQLHKVISIE